MFRRKTNLDGYCIVRKWYRRTTTRKNECFWIVISNSILVVEITVGKYCSNCGKEKENKESKFCKHYGHHFETAIDEESFN